MDDLAGMLERWVERGLLSPDQARAIRSFEASSSAGRVPIVSEVLGYLGAALALIAVTVATAQVWTELEGGEKALLLGTVSAALGAAGWWIRGSDMAPIRRLFSFLWFLSSAGAGFFFESLTRDAGGVDDGAVIVAGVGMTAYSFVLWRMNPAALQQIALFAGAVVLIAGIGDLFDTGEHFGPLTWMLGLAWILLTRGGFLSPRRASYALGASGLLIGSQALVFEGLFTSSNGWGIALGLVSAAGLLGASLVLGEMVLLGLGTAGVFIFLPQAVEEYLGDGLGAPLVLFVSGLGILGVALLSARLRHQVK